MVRLLALSSDLADACPRTVRQLRRELRLAQPLRRVCQQLLPMAQRPHSFQHHEPQGFVSKQQLERLLGRLRLDPLLDQERRSQPVPAVVGCFSSASTSASCSPRRSMPAPSSWAPGRRLESRRKCGIRLISRPLHCCWCNLQRSFGFSVVLATVFRSPTASALGALLCWAVCSGINGAHHEISAHASASPAAIATSEKDRSEPTRLPNRLTYHPVLVSVVQACYWVLPKPIDTGYYVFRERHAADFVAPPAAYDALSKSGSTNLRLSLATSLASALFLLFVATQQFRATDY